MYAEQRDTAMQPLHFLQQLLQQEQLRVMYGHLSVLCSQVQQFDSGTVNSQVLTVTYSSNAAAATGDSAKVYYTSDCGNSLSKAQKLSNAVLNGPAAPASIIITPIVTNVCGARRYRYTAPVLPAQTATASFDTGYVWSFVGALGANATIDSGTVNTRIITVTYTSNAAAQTGDSVELYYTSSCGNTNYKAMKLSNTLLTVPVAPTAITITPVVTNICGQRRYRYSAPALPAATAANGAATGYVWSFLGDLFASGVVDSADLHSRVFTVTYSSNAAATINDSVKLYYTSDCGNGLTKGQKLSNTVLSTPAAPASITITPIVTNICGARRYRYAAPLLPAQTATASFDTCYVWSCVGTLGSNSTIDSGTVNSRIITVTYSSNAAAQAGDSIEVYYTSSCGNTPYKAQKLSNTLLTVPVAPTAITITPVVTNICGQRRYRYAAPALPAATAANGAATGYVWSFTNTDLGNNAVVDSGSLTSQVFTVT